jgi:hypothetical protein
MSTKNPTTDEVEQLLLNAQLRTELEPFLDEATDLLSMQRVPLEIENDFLASMLAWERAPALPISRWFSPELVLPHPDSLTDSQLNRLLWDTIHRLHVQRIVLEFTDHLSDRELYCVIARDILPSYEKKIEEPRNYLHWHCLDESESELWLTYYATDEERRTWLLNNDGALPERKSIQYPRKMPSRPQGM